MCVTGTTLHSVNQVRSRNSVYIDRILSCSTHPHPHPHMIACTYVHTHIIAYIHIYTQLINVDNTPQASQSPDSAKIVPGNFAVTHCAVLLYVSVCHSCRRWKTMKGPILCASVVVDNIALNHAKVVEVMCVQPLRVSSTPLSIPDGLTERPPSTRKWTLPRAGHLLDHPVHPVHLVHPHHLDHLRRLRLPGRQSITGGPPQWSS